VFLALFVEMMGLALAQVVDKGDNAGDCGDYYRDGDITW
jgi:hypothetical protein